MLSPLTKLQHKLTKSFVWSCLWGQGTRYQPNFALPALYLLHTLAHLLPNYNTKCISNTRIVVKYTSWHFSVIFIILGQKLYFIAFITSLVLQWIIKDVELTCSRLQGKHQVRSVECFPGYQDHLYVPTRYFNKFSRCDAKIKYHLVDNDIEDIKLELICIVNVIVSYHQPSFQIKIASDVT